MAEIVQFPGGPAGPPAPPPTEGHAPATGDPVAEAVSYSDYATKTFMAIVAKLVRYQDYCKEMKIDRFQASLRLAMYDQFSSFPDAVKAKKISSPSGYSYREADCEKIRQAPEYARIQADILRVVDLLTDPGSVDKLAEVLEGANAEELLRIAHFSPSARDKKAAIEEFTSRRSAKKGRDLAAREMVLPDRFMEQLMAGAAAVAAVLAQAGQQAQISAAEINVPGAKLIGEGRVER